MHFALQYSSQFIDRSRGANLVTGPYALSKYSQLTHIISYRNQSLQF